jgi:hypothetical protein
MPRSGAQGGCMEKVHQTSVIETTNTWRKLHLIMWARLRALAEALVWGAPAGYLLVHKLAFLTFRPLMRRAYATIRQAYASEDSYVRWRLLHYSAQLARGKFKILAALLWVLVSFIATIVVGLIVIYTPINTTPFKANIFQFENWIIGSTLGIVILYVIPRGLRNLVFVSLVIGIAWRNIFPSAPETIVEQLLPIIIMVWSMLINLSIHAVAIFFIILILTRGTRSKYPDAWIVGRLSRIIEVLNPSTAPLLDLPKRQDALRLIEEIALTIERELVRALRTGDLDTDLRFQDKASRMAAAFREKKMWVLTPMPDTAVHATVWFRQSLVKISHGDWNRLDLAERPQSPQHPF